MSELDHKGAYENNEYPPVFDKAPSDGSSAGFNDRGTKRLLRKIDLYLIPLLSLLYLLSFLDRSNIGNAKLAGLPSSLKLKGLQFNNALAIFFPFYVLAEVPSNLMMKLTRPSIWIPTIMVVWGLVCTMMGLVKNYRGLMAARVFLGLAEGGLFPGVTFYITMWYRRHECGRRMAIFFSAATAAGAFGGLLAYGIGFMNNVAGLRSWQWIFILEGIATFVVGCAAYFLLHDYPDTAKFLTKEERKEVQRRLEHDRGMLADEFATKYILDAFKDWKIWVNCMITVGIFSGLYSVSLFMPTIVQGLGHKDKDAQLMTVPPYVVACLFCIGSGFAADKAKQRGLFQIGMVGILMLLLSESNHVKYAGVFFTTVGIYSNVPQCTAWNSNNIGGTTKRSVGMAMQVGIGNLAGTMSAYMFLPKDASKHFAPGYKGLLGLAAMSCALSIGMTIYLRMENNRRDKEFKKPEEYTVAEMALEREKGDNASFFRYTV
ncbi:high-affinity nicotinic acid transporter [Venturia nashicola]|uniref:High-affinity nicotinic acid transporter n=1 Tax=Venturia nashicola TaxID=86259 RepID=A0A4Z1PNS7_9PEZI|nr:high-affinity nicotinic acid transporter [Venturia nashicola]